MTTNNTTVPVKEQYKAILALEKEMKKYSDDRYDDLQDKLKKALISFIRDDFSVLNSKQILKLCSLVNSHRPVALHTFLIYCSNLINE